MQELGNSSAFISNELDDPSREKENLNADRSNEISQRLDVFCTFGSRCLARVRSFGATCKTKSSRFCLYTSLCSRWCSTYCSSTDSSGTSAHNPRRATRTRVAVHVCTVASRLVDGEAFCLAVTCVHRGSVHYSRACTLRDKVRFETVGAGIGPRSIHVFFNVKKIRKLRIFERMCVLLSWLSWSESRIIKI